MISTHLRIPDDGGLPALVDEAAALGEAGLDLGIVYLPAPPHARRCWNPWRRRSAADLTPLTNAGRDRAPSEGGPVLRLDRGTWGGYSIATAGIDLPGDDPPARPTVDVRYPCSGPLDVTYI